MESVTITSCTHSLITDQHGKVIQSNNNDVLIQDNLNGNILAISLEIAREVFGFTPFENLNGNRQEQEFEPINVDITVNQTPKKNLWNRNAILRLIFLYSKYENKFKSTTIKNEAVYKIISEDLAKEGYIFSATQCRDKFKYLKLKYLKVKDNKKNTGEEKINFDYFSEMDEIFGKKPTANPVALASSIRGYADNNLDNNVNLLVEETDTETEPKETKRKRKREDDVERRHQERMARQDKALSFFERYLQLLENNNK